MDHESRNIGHGTSTASLAIGRTYGIAPKANPYLIKIASSIIMHGGRRQTAYEARASEDALQHVIRIVKERNLQGKAVVNHSFGTL